MIPRSVIDDQQPLTQSEAFRNVSGVSGMPTNALYGYAYKVRGFPADRYVDGLPNWFDGGDFLSLVDTERIEVLKGPSGLWCQTGLNPVGGIINSVSKLPTPTRSYEIGLVAGGFGLWNPWFDVNQPLNSSGTALFRMTGDFARSRDYVDVIEHQRYSLDPTLTLTNDEDAKLTIQGRFTVRAGQLYGGLPGAGTADTSGFAIRRDLFPSTADLPTTATTYNGLTLRLEHEFSPAWSINASARISQGRLANSLSILPPTHLCSTRIFRTSTAISRSTLARFHSIRTLSASSRWATSRTCSCSARTTTVSRPTSGSMRRLQAWSTLQPRFSDIRPPCPRTVDELPRLARAV